eukprot:TRINITY_DN21646_c0_g1_i1.p1 TRINITY_DN21646_c0_g1~~TRINITY_DN21646_c0_g1_i1.p1  ORF type:complete len:837 (+),score=132.38 TRINITY_DN21646_c0_g1_i1:65-2512(+)
MKAINPSSFRHEEKEFVAKESDDDLGGDGYMPLGLQGEEEEEEIEVPITPPRPVLRFPARKKEEAQLPKSPLGSRPATAVPHSTMSPDQARTPARRRVPLMTKRPGTSPTSAPPSSVRALRSLSQAPPERDNDDIAHLSLRDKHKIHLEREREREKDRKEKEKEREKEKAVAEVPPPPPPLVVSTHQVHRYRDVRRKPRKIKERVKIYVNAQYAKPVVLNGVHTAKCEFAPLRDGANMIWTDRSISVETAKTLIDEKQRLNRFPGMRDLCNKVLFTHHMNRMSMLFPDDFSFYPQTFCLPGDEDEIEAAIPTFKKKSKKKVDQQRPMWIVKPSRGAQGAGIFITQDVHEILGERRNPDVPYVVQRYVADPLLIDGLKFDLRVYVLVLCVDPLKIYVFDEGLARFATNKYVPLDANNIRDAYMHLTNYSLNKDSSNFVPNTDATQQDVGSKRNLKSIRDWLTANGHDATEAWKGINSLVVNTMLALQPSLQINLEAISKPADDAYKCFQILGFDVMFDEKLKPWLLEVNAGPSLEASSPLDQSIKEPLVASALKLGTYGLLPRHRPSLRKSYESSHKGQYVQVYPCTDSHEHEHLVLFNKELRECFDKACGLKKGEMSATRFCKFFRECGVVRSFRQLGASEKKPAVLRVEESIERPTTGYASNKAFELRKKMTADGKREDHTGHDADEYRMPEGYEPKYGLKTFNIDVPANLVDKIRTLTQPELELLFLKKNKNSKEGQTGLTFFEFINIVVELSIHAYGNREFEAFTMLQKLRLFIPKRGGTPQLVTHKQLAAREARDAAREAAREAREHAAKP